MQKGIGAIYIFVILALLILAGSVGYVYYISTTSEGPIVVPSSSDMVIPESLFTPSSSPHPDWAHLVNTYGYEISYPEEYQVLSNHFGIQDPAMALDISIQDPESPLVVDSSNGITHKKRINIRVAERKNITSLEQYAEAKYNVSRDAGYTTSQIKKSIIDGREAYEFTVNHGYRDENGGFLIYPENRTIWILEGSNIYWLMYPLDDPLFKEIVASLRFIK